MFRILVVEDDRDLRELFCRTLMKNSFNAIGAENADKALELLETEYIDLIISDVMMAGMNGFELVKELREAGNDTVTDASGSQILPQKEFMLLYKLLSYPGQIFTRQQILDDIWGIEEVLDSHTLDVHISRLRERFRSNPDFKIVTIRGLGYRAVKNDK